MRFLITRISEAFKEVNLEDLESELRDYGLRAMFGFFLARAKVVESG